MEQVSLARLNYRGWNCPHVVLHCWLPVKFLHEADKTGIPGDLQTTNGSSIIEPNQRLSLMMKVFILVVSILLS